MYTLSKDYEKLWSFVANGDEPLCFVDYKWSETKTCRDVARIKRNSSFQIQIGVRGIQYGGVDTWYEEHENSEKEAFINECKELNLEWVCP